MKQKKSSRHIKIQNLIRLLLLLCILISINVISSFRFARIDLTSEKRYTLSDATKNLLKNLPDVIYVKIYLSGDFPPGFKRLQNSTRELLDEMRVYASDNLQYEFINPSGNPDSEQRNKLYRQLFEKGLQPTTLQEKDKEGTSEKMIFPGAIISFSDKEHSVQLLKEQAGMAPEQALNASIEGLEYEFSSTIRKITAHSLPSIALIEGHGELQKNYVADITKTMEGSYNVERKKIDGKLGALKSYSTIIIAKPDSAFDEKDKFIIDQFIMKGGKVIWLLDLIAADMDSLAQQNEFIAPAKDLNLDDMLFRYGVRVNYNLVQDIQSAYIPMVTGTSAGRPQQKLLPWFYFPLVFPQSKHPVVNNLNGIRFQFAGTIDTVGAREIKKTILLATSKYTKVLAPPVLVSIDIIRKEPEINTYNQPSQFLAVLLEGSFKSSFTNRIPPVIAEDEDIAFSESGVPGKMVVIADGDVIRNDYSERSGNILPLGYDRYARQMYGNKNFMLNVIDYLNDGSGLITLRSKEIKLRLLDKTLVKKQQAFWQIMNTAGPLIFIFIFGIIKYYRRQRKFAV